MRIDYSAVGYDENGRNVMDPVWSDMDIRADGFESVDAATEGARNLFHHSSKVAFVSIRESVQEIEGCSWRAGNGVKKITREEFTAWNVNDFLAARPEYDRKHVEGIARSCEEDGIPFCVQCKDWHQVNDDHSA